MKQTALKALGYTALVVLGFVAMVYMALTIFGVWYDEWSGYNASLNISNGMCNIAVVPITGTIVPYMDVDEEGTATETYTTMNDAVSLISRANADPCIQGVLVYVDSTGGSPVASETIANSLKDTPLPVAGLIGESGASGGYLVATGADTIFASPFSDVGSIGISMSYIDNSVQNRNNGLEFISLSSGKFKDTGSPDRALTREERVLYERDLKIYHDEFVRQVAQNRNLPVEDVVRLADGWSMPASLALENKLIDAIGDYNDAREWFAEKLDLPVNEVVFCE